MLRLSPIRRVAAFTCGVGLLIALFVAAVHNHSAPGANARSDGACMYCSGGIVATKAPEIAPAAQRIWRMVEPVRPQAPALRRWMRLDHSGNAPPA